ncbi:hypothetical protein WH367_16330 [Comamonas sp. MYb21]|uniref:hypothetical protein n=1 Tax=unclassified Comamonas TaxID=2638500 RepID=UPI0003955D19|nr:hypothetical protein [Comamonas sp. B-9]
MTAIKMKRGSRAQIEAAASVGGLAAGEPYLVTDKEAIAVGTGAGSFSQMIAGSGVGKVTLSATEPAAPKFGDVWIQITA